MRLNVKVQILDSKAILPKYAHDGDNGDLAADLCSIEETVLQPGAVARLRTGIAIELPDGYGALIEDRSGLASRGITTLAGVVDPGYRGTHSDYECQSTGLSDCGGRSYCTA